MKKAGGENGGFYMFIYLYMFIYNPNKTKIWETVYVPPVENVKRMVKCLVCCVRDLMKNQFLLNLKNETHLLDLVEKKNQERKESRF